jgi:hypothetical protein
VNRFSLSFVVVTGLCAALGLQAQATRPNLTGTWNFDASKSTLKHTKAPDKRVLKIAAGRDKINVHDTWTDSGKDDVKTWECSTVGKECEYKDEGKAVKASMFYNGPTLMEFRTIGDDVMRRRMTLAEDGNTLEVQIEYITPQRDTEKLVFIKAPTPTETASAPATNQ